LFSQNLLKTYSKCSKFSFIILEYTQDIINVNDHKFVQLFMEDRFHEGGEHQQNITQPKWHHQEFLWAILSPHYHVFHILIHNVNLIVPWFEINLAKVLCPIELIQQIINVG
jgi:hypothetical protein